MSILVVMRIRCGGNCAKRLHLALIYLIFLIFQNNIVYEKPQKTLQSMARRYAKNLFRLVWQHLLQPQGGISI